jgi:hypothetical protein
MVRWRKGGRAKGVGFVVRVSVRVAPPRDMNRDPVWRRLNADTGTAKVKGLSDETGLDPGRRDFAESPVHGRARTDTPPRRSNSKRNVWETGEVIGRAVSRDFSRRPLPDSAVGAFW